MVETILPGANPPLPRTSPVAATAAPRAEPTNPDGSAIPDIIANHHRPEDLGDHSNQDVSIDDSGESALFGEDGLTFGDVLDIINPLQHIPIVSTIYRAVTGDEISPGARVAGGALFGGPVGFAVATANAVVEAATGDDIGEGLVALVTGDSPAAAEATVASLPDPTTSLAEANPAIVGAGTVPASVLQSLAALPTLQGNALPANPAPSASAKLPFGGLGALPFTKAQPAPNDPVAALLQARAAVPSAGPIPNLGNNTAPILQAAPAIPTINPRLADKLTILAAQSAPESTPSQDSAKPDKPHIGSVPTPLVPQQMTDTLDRYERMKKAELTTP